MLRAITNKRRIASIQDSFKKAMLHDLRKSCMLKFGYKGGNKTLKAHHDDKLWFATKFRSDANFYWNVYGLNPKSRCSNDNTVQINIPVKGINRLIGGLFAENKKAKKVYLMHRGRVGGGRKGIGKTAFVSWYKGRARTVYEQDERSSKAFLVTAIHDPHIANKVVRFVQDVSRFKRLHNES